MSFDRIQGQNQAVEQLRAALATGRVSHAYLFHGPEGTGRRLAAQELAKAINCEAPLGDRGTDACDECLSCRRMAHGTHPDFHVLEMGSKGGENVGIEQVRQLVSDVSLRPTAGRRKVYVVPSAHRFSPPAFHTILKTLEEPPPYVTLILIVPELSEILPTVISRCQLVRFVPLPREIIERLLMEQGVEPTMASEAAAICGGSLSRALTLARSPEALERRRELFGVLREALRAPLPQALRLAEDLQRLSTPPKTKGAAKSEEEDGAEASEATQTPKSLLLELLDETAGWYRDLLALRSGAPLRLLGNPDYEAKLEKLAEGVGEAYLVEALELIQTARHAIDRNANPRVTLEVLLMELILRRS
ncbi:MAG TPA: DNA polymerase III subunit delta' [Armatimonadota bacterium]|jgi:DNA polymerase-3 subunit delta'